MHQPEGAVQVAVHDQHPVFVALGFRYIAAGNAGGVDEDVDLAVVGDDVFHAAGDGLWLGQVQIVRIAADAIFLFDFGCVFFQTIHTACHNGHIRASGSHGLRKLQTQSRRAASANSNFTGQIKLVILHHNCVPPDI